MSHPREPIKHTCPDIDKIIKSVKQALKQCNRYEKDEEEQLKDRLWEINYYLGDVEELLEKLRHSNQTLREWGIEEALEVDELKKEGVPV